MKPTTDREWQAFCRSFANQTSNIKLGEKSVVSIFTADNQYLVLADGYMSGVIYDKVDINERMEVEKLYATQTGENIIDKANEILGNRKGNNDFVGDSFAYGRADRKYDELDEFIENHPEFFRNKRETYRDYKKRTEQSESPITEADPIDGPAYSLPEVGKAFAKEIAGSWVFKTLYN